MIPWLRKGPKGLAAYPAAATIRGLTRSLTEEARLPDSDAAALAAGTPDMVARVLWRLAAAVRAYGSLIRADLGAVRDPDGSELARHLTEAREQRDLLALMLQHAPEPAAAGWRLRGEILVHLDRLTSELQVERLSRPRQDGGGPSWRQALHAVRSRLPAG